MAECVMIYGKSGSGKSRSLKDFADDEIFLVNVEGKRLPFKNNFKYVMNPKADKDLNVDVIKAKLASMPTKVAVIDDVGYLMTQLFMTHHRGLKGNGVFELYNDIADTMFSLVTYIKKNLPDDVIVYLMFHEDTNDYMQTKIKTIGRLLDNQVCLEGMVTICIRCVTEDGQHYFRTFTDGNDITKTPEGMFETDKIENNLKTVDTIIREFYSIK